MSVSVCVSVSVSMCVRRRFSVCECEHGEGMEPGPGMLHGALTLLDTPLRSSGTVSPGRTCTGSGAKVP